MDSIFGFPIQKLAGMQVSGWIALKHHQILIFLSISLGGSNRGNSFLEFQKFLKCSQNVIFHHMFLIRFGISAKLSFQPYITWFCFGNFDFWFSPWTSLFPGKKRLISKNQPKYWFSDHVSYTIHNQRQISDLTVYNMTIFEGKKISFPLWRHTWNFLEIYLGTKKVHLIKMIPWVHIIDFRREKFGA